MPARQTIGVAFLQSQAFFGADSAVHAQLMRHLDRSAARVHCACTAEVAHDPRMTSLPRIRAIPDVAVRVTDFGPTLFARRSSRLLTASQALRATVRGTGLVRYLRRERIDILHGTEKPRDALVGVLLARLSGARSVVHMHVGYGEWLTPRARWALGAADALVGVSEFVSRSLVAAGYHQDRVFTVHNSLDLTDPEWVRPPETTTAVRSELGVPADAPAIAIASRLYRWKGHHDLVEALALLRPELPDARLVIIGEDDPRANPGGGSYRQELAARIRELDLERNVVFTGFRTDVARLLAACDVFCQPSAEEPFGMVYLEAMAMHRPVVAYASGGAPEVVVHGETGLLAERGDITALSRALLRLLGDVALRRRFGDAGRRRVADVFRPERSAAAMLDVYRAVVEGRGLQDRAGRRQITPR